MSEWNMGWVWSGTGMETGVERLIAEQEARQIIETQCCSVCPSVCPVCVCMNNS